MVLCLRGRHMLLVSCVCKQLGFAPCLSRHLALMVLDEWSCGACVPDHTLAASDSSVPRRVRLSASRKGLGWLSPRVVWPRRQRVCSLALPGGGGFQASCLDYSFGRSGEEGPQGFGAHPPPSIARLWGGSGHGALRAPAFSAYLDF